MNALDQIQSGDHVAVDYPSFMGRRIKATLSTRKRRCHHWHDAIVIRRKGELCVYNETWPYSRIDPLAEYLQWVVKKRGRWAVTRPDWVDAKPLALQERWRRHIDTAAYFMTGNRYPLKDLWCIFKRQNWFLRKLRILKPNERAHFYCTSAVRHLWQHNPIYAWVPDALARQRLPAPIHMEHAMRERELAFIVQNEPGFFEQMSEPLTPGEEP